MRGKPIKKIGKYSNLPLDAVYESLELMEMSNDDFLNYEKNYIKRLDKNLTKEFKTPKKKFCIKELPNLVLLMGMAMKN